jgi:hypothetical protein
VVVSTEEASAVARSTAVVVSVEDVSPVAVSTVVAFVGVSTAVAFVATVLVITDSLMMSSSATSAFRHGGAGAIRTDITVTTITRTLTMDTGGTHTATTVAGATVTTVALVMDIAIEAERVMDFATAAKPVTDTALAADQRMSGVRGVGDKRGYCSLKIRDEATCESSKSVRLMFGDEFGE